MIVASGYTLAFDRFDPACDVGMVAPRMLGPEVRRCFEEGIGFITAFGVHRDVTGRARERILAVAKAIGGLRQGAHRDDRACRRRCSTSPSSRRCRRRCAGVSSAFVGVMLEHGIPLEAILTELFLSGEVERTYRLLRDRGLRRADGAPLADEPVRPAVRGRGRYDDLDVPPPMREIVDGIASRAASPTSGTPSGPPASPRSSASRAPRSAPTSPRSSRPAHPARRVRGTLPRSAVTSAQLVRKSRHRSRQTSWRLSSLPVGRRGSSSTKSTEPGTCSGEVRAAVRDQLGPASPAAAVERVTTAFTSSPSSAFGTPITATSATAGCIVELVLDLLRVDVDAAGDDHVRARSVRYRKPSSSR